MTSLTPEHRAAIEARLSAAPDGPWFVPPMNEADLEYSEVRVCQEPQPRHVIARCCVSTDQAAWLIAHAPTDLAALLAALAERDAEVARLEKKVEQLEEWLDEAGLCRGCGRDLSAYDTHWC